MNVSMSFSSVFSFDTPSGSPFAVQTMANTKTTISDMEIFFSLRQVEFP